MKVAKFGLLFILLLSLLVVLVFLSRTLNVSLNDNDAKQSKRSVLDRDYFTGKSTEIPTDVPDKDMRLQYIWRDKDVISLLIDYTPTYITEGGSPVHLNRRNVIKSWIQNGPVHPKMFLTPDHERLVISAYGVFIYDFQSGSLRDLQVDSRIEMVSTEIIGIENNSIIFGLYEGRGGICDDRALSVDIDTFRITQLQPKSSMQRCQL